MRGGLPAQRVRLLLGADALSVAFYDECEARIRFDTNDCAHVRENIYSCTERAKSKETFQPPDAESKPLPSTSSANAACTKRRTSQALFQAARQEGGGARSPL